MLGWFKALMPREDRFFELFAAHSAIVVAGAEALRSVLQGGSSVKQFCEIVSEKENEADEITRQVLLAVRRTFITPFDRTDIQDLISALDDAIDEMNKTAKTIMLFELREFEPEMQKIGDIILQASNLIFKAMPLLASIPKNADQLSALTEEVIRIEDQADRLYDAGRKGLFLSSKKDERNVMQYIVGNELYDHLEAVVDKLEDVSNEINALIVDQI